jgi:RecB family exonuclease
MESVGKQLQLLEDVINLSLDRLSSGQHRGLLPLEGKHRMMAIRALATASTWAPSPRRKSMDGKSSPQRYSGSLRAGQAQSQEHAGEKGSSLLVEESLKSKRWRLEGRADLIRIDSDFVEIIDFKTGRVQDEGGEILDGIILQMHAYALMAAERWPSRDIRLRVLGHIDLDVPNEPLTLRRVQEMLFELETMYPDGTVLNADDSARCGQGCRFCRLRTVCSPYLKRAPEEWARLMPRRERISTNDIWGKYLERDDRFGAVLIEIPEGRKAKVFGFLPEEIDELIPGSLVGAFGCETEEQASLRGNSNHPVNWWIRRNGRDIAGVRLFAGPGRRPVSH